MDPLALREAIARDQQRFWRLRHREAFRYWVRLMIVRVHFERATAGAGA